MNLFQKHSQASLLDLKIQLADFGLKPSDWKLLKTEEDQIKIQNKIESSFYFYGSTQQTAGKNTWKNICLISL